LEKVTLFFVSILVFTIAGVIFINPKGLEKTSSREEPVFEFKDYTYYDIDVNGVDEYLVSDSAYHYDDRDEIHTITYFKRGKVGIDRLRSETATIYGTHTDFNGSVTYLQRDGYKLISKDVRYNDKNGSITGNNPFTVTSDHGDFNGSKFEIDIKKRVLKADNIRSTYIYE